MSNKIKAGIIGGAGYTGGELARLLLHHPDAELSYSVSKSQQGKALSAVHSDLTGDTEMLFSAEPEKGADVIFLCLPHGESKKFLQQNKYLLDSKVVDLSRDFRIRNQEPRTKKQSSPYPEFIYGLPELNRSAIKKAQYIANPGCFATAIQLALLPLAHEKLLENDIHVNATTGSTGAGQSLSNTAHYSWRNNNLSVYKPFEHEHLAEIGQSLTQLQENFSVNLHFVPQRGSFTRGILASCSFTSKLSQGEVEDLYKTYYADHPYVHTSSQVDIKQVTNTNKCFIQLIKHKDQLAIISVIDNLLKGASGQAVQNMNLMFGLEETAGLKLKANVY